MANHIINKKQQTVRFRMDLMSGHVDKSVNDAFYKWLNDMYGSSGEVVATRGKVHSYLGMTLIF